MSYQLINASAHDTGLADKSVHCVVTSPPYMGLRSYHGEQDVDWPEVRYSPMPGLSEIVIPGCDPNCRHEWGDPLLQREQSGRSRLKWETGGDPAAKLPSGPVSQGCYCIHCGGMKSGLGNEPTPEAFIGHLILVMREMWRVLRDDGVCWVNLGDSYNGSGGAGGDYGVGGLKEGQPKYPGRKVGTLKPKDLIMVPARFALAAQADGWYLRQDCVWHKTAPMPESVTDRCTKAHEFIYLLTKQPKYYFDADAIREPNVTTSNIRNKSLEKHNDAVLSPIGKGEREWNNPNGRNKRSVWTINPSNYHGAHFATFPLEIPLTCIKAGCPQDGTVLDPFNGSGTTGRAALQLGRSYIGVDVCNEYLTDLAPERMSNVQMEMCIA